MKKIQLINPSRNVSNVGLARLTSERRKRLKALLCYLENKEQQPETIIPPNKANDVYWCVDGKAFYIWSNHEITHWIRFAIRSGCPWLNPDLISDESIDAIKKEYGAVNFLGVPLEGVATYYEGDEAKYYIVDAELTDSQSKSSK